MIKYKLECILISKNLKKDMFYLNQEVLEPSHAFGLISTWEVSIGTLRVSTGSLGYQALFSILVRFGLLFWGFLSWEMHLDMFLIRILKINPFFLDIQVFKVIIIDKYSKKTYLSTISLLSNYSLYSYTSKFLFYTNRQPITKII